MYKMCILGMAFGEHNIQSFNGIYKTWYSFLIRSKTTGIYEYWGDMMHYALYELPWLLYWEKNGGEAKIVWSSGEFDTHHGGTVLIDGKLFGPTWINNDRGQWTCYDWETGKQIYLDTWEGRSKGSIAAADGMIYCYEERKGTVALIDPSKDKFAPVSSFDVKFGSGRHWCHPIISDGVLYIRRGKVLTAFDIKEK